MRFAAAEQPLSAAVALALQRSLPLCCEFSSVSATLLRLLSPSQIYQFSVSSASLRTLSTPISPHPFILTDVKADASGPQKESISDIKRPNEWEPPVCVPAAKQCSCTGAGWHKQKPRPIPPHLTPASLLGNPPQKARMLCTCAASD